MKYLVNSEEDGLETSLMLGNQLGEIIAGIQVIQNEVYGGSGLEMKVRISK